MKVFFYIAVASLLLLTIGCKDTYTLCEESTTVNYKAGFYNKNGAADIPVTPSSLTLTFPGISTFIYNKQQGVSTLVLALNPTTDSLKYFIKVAETLPADTITFVYSTGIQQLGPECGSITTHNLTRAATTTHTLDSVKIMAPAVNNIPAENIRIYY